MKQIQFERQQGQRYYALHYKFFIQTARAVAIDVKFNLPPRKERGFHFIYEGQKILVDFGDHFDVAADIDNFDACFRFHYSEKHHHGHRRTFPLTPISFHNWPLYFRLIPEIQYNHGKYIYCRQKPGANAVERRTRVRYLLNREYKTFCGTKGINQTQFWRVINSCLVSVCVPGARMDILDRGQFQYLAFGAVTISPELDIVLPYWEKPKEGVHYVPCDPDFADVIDAVEDCRNNREGCLQMGKKARELFLKTSTPDKIWAWINKWLRTSTKRSKQLIQTPRRRNSRHS